MGKGGRRGEDVRDVVAEMQGIGSEIGGGSLTTTLEFESETGLGAVSYPREGGSKRRSAGVNERMNSTAISGKVECLAGRVGEEGRRTEAEERGGQEGWERYGQEHVALVRQIEAAVVLVDLEDRLGTLAELDTPNLLINMRGSGRWQSRDAVEPVGGPCALVAFSAFGGRSHEGVMNASQVLEEVSVKATGQAVQRVDGEEQRPGVVDAGGRGARGHGHRCAGKHKGGCEGGERAGEQQKRKWQQQLQQPRWVMGWWCWYQGR